MGCFYYFKEKYKLKKRAKSAPSQSTNPPLSPPNSTNYSTNKDSFSDSSNVSSSKTTKSIDSISTQSRSLPDLYGERAHNVRVFEYKELRDATKNFNRELKLGEGGFGSVYKGFLRGKIGNGDDDLWVAVKRLNRNSLQGHKQWLAEVQFLAVVDHPNLVKLIGYCAVDGERGPQRLLVYEFIPNKTLFDHLFDKAYPCLPLNLRLKIVLGAAEGLLYLHEGLEIQVIYRDFKASNVLLDNEFRPKLSDFGLAREGPTAEKTHVSTAVMGTIGYAAPDYVETGHLTAKSDVWSFGVVLYEILTGRCSMDRNRPKNEKNLLDWVKQFPIDSKKFSKIIDPRLGRDYSLSGAREIARLANNCLAKQARDRPTMREVVETLKRVLEIVEIGGGEEGESSLSPTKEDLVEIKQEERESRVPESSRRRVDHLARLAENVSGVTRRRFLHMKVRNPVR